MHQRDALLSPFVDALLSPFDRDALLSPFVDAYFSLVSALPLLPSPALPLRPPRLELLNMYSKT